MKRSINLFKELSDYIVHLYGVRYKVPLYEHKTSFMSYLELTLDELRKDFGDLSKNTFFCFDTIDTKILRMRYGAYDNEFFPFSTISSELCISINELNSRYEMCMVIMHKKIFDYILNKVEKQPIKVLIAEMDFSIKEKRILMNDGIFYIDDLIKYNSNELSSIRGIGNKIGTEIIKKVHEFGYQFKDETDDELIDSEHLRKALVNQLKLKKDKLLELDFQIDCLRLKQDKVEYEIIDLLKKIDKLDNHTK